MQDIQHFKWEYIDQQPVLNNPLQLKDGRVVSLGYGEVPMTSYTNKDERKGASYAEAEIVSTWLPQAPNETMFLSTSPQGETGITDFQGKRIVHPESQTKIYYKNKSGTLEAYTLRTSMTLEQNIALMQKISGKKEICDGEYKSEFDLICDVTSTVISTRNHTPEQIVDMLGEIKGDTLIWSKKEASATVYQMHQALNKARRQTEVDSRIEKIIEKFSREMNRYQGNLSEAQIKELSILIGSTVIEIHDELKGKSKDSKTSVSRISELGGCAGGGSESSVKTRVVNGEVQYFVKKCGQCGIKIEGYIPKGYICKSCKGKFKGC